MSRDTLRTPAWLLIGLFKSVPGTLELVNANLTFVSETETVFAISLSDSCEVRFPWYYFGAGVVFSLESKRHRLSFIGPGDSGDIVSGREAGKRWKQRLDKNK